MTRQRRHADGTHSAAESYHSDMDERGKARRQNRRNTRKAAAVKEKKKAYAAGKRNDNSDSDYSYRSGVSNTYVRTSNQGQPYFRGP